MKKSLVTVLICFLTIGFIKQLNGQTFNVKFFWSFVFEKINNNWKVVHSHQSRAN